MDHGTGRADRPDPADDLYRQLVGAAGAVGEPARPGWRDRLRDGLPAAPALRGAALPAAVALLVVVAVVVVVATRGSGELGGDRPIAVRTDALARQARAGSPAPERVDTSPASSPSELPPVAVAPDPATAGPEAPAAPRPASPGPASPSAAQPLPLPEPVEVPEPVGLPAPSPVADPGDDAPPTTTEPPAPGRAGPPGAVRAVASDSRAVVTWRPPATNGGAPVRHYVVTTRPGGRSVTTTELRRTVTGLVNGRAYSFTVTAVTAAGAGAESPASAPVVPATMPRAPGPPAVLAGDRAATVSWPVPADGGAPITRYDVVASPGGRTVSVSRSPARVSGLTNGTAYTFTVRAANRVGAGGRSRPSAAVTPAGRPAAPKAVAATAGDGAVSLRWSAPDANGAPITGYDVSVSPGTTRRVGVGAAAGVTIDGLRNGTAYTFTVAARNRVGRGARSAPSTPVTPRWVTSTTAQANVTALTYGYSVAVSARVLRTRDGSGASGVPVSLHVRYAGNVSWQRVATGATGTDGGVRLTHAPRRHAVYVVRFDGDAASRSSDSAAQDVQVRALVRLGHPTALRVTAGSYVTIHGRVDPAHAGQRVSLQRLVGGSWSTTSTQVLSASSGFSWRMQRPTRGTFYFRVVFAGHIDHLGGTSPTVKVSVV